MYEARARRGAWGEERVPRRGDGNTPRCVCVCVRERERVGVAVRGAEGALEWRPSFARHELLLHSIICELICYSTASSQTERARAPRYGRLSPAGLIALVRARLCGRQAPPLTSRAARGPCGRTPPLAAPAGWRAAPPRRWRCARGAGGAGGGRRFSRHAPQRRRPPRPLPSPRRAHRCARSCPARDTAERQGLLPRLWRAARGAGARRGWGGVGRVTAYAAGKTAMPRCGGLRAAWGAPHRV